MKKNIVMLVVDAFSYKYLGKSKFKNSSTPFLDKLLEDPKTKNISNMYSEAPYTVAALMGLLGGVDTMSNGSYMKVLSNTDCLLKEFNNNGYTVYANCYQSSIYPSGTLIGANNLYYNSSFNFKTCYDYRIYNYANLYNQNKITSDEYSLVIDILEDNFKEAILFSERLLNNDSSVSIIIDGLDISNIENEIILITKEYKKFKRDKKKYINEVFKEKENHIICNLYSYPTINKIPDKNIRLEIERRYKPLLKYFYKKNKWLNIKNNRISSRKLFNLIKHDKDNAKKFLRSYASCIFDKDLVARVEEKSINTIKTISSCDKMFRHFIDWHRKFKSENPFFAYIHFDDIHFREIFFTHDSSNLELLEEEFNIAKEYVDKLPKKYKGNLAYDLGVRYVDSKIEMLYNYLKENNMLDTTDIIITSDHGNSYTYQNIRESYVINFYEENYHVPCIFYTDTKIEINRDSFYQTKDIPATILHLNNIKVPESYTGKSLNEFDGRDYVVAEYIGHGCPDIINNKIKMSIRTKEKSLFADFSILNPNDINITDIYDLINDPNENINLVFQKNEINIQKEIEYMKYEISMIIKTNDFIKSVK